MYTDGTKNSVKAVPMAMPATSTGPMLLRAAAPGPDTSVSGGAMSRHGRRGFLTRRTSGVTSSQILQRACTVGAARRGDRRRVVCDIFISIAIRRYGHRDAGVGWRSPRGGFPLDSRRV